MLNKKSIKINVLFAVIGAPFIKVPPVEVTVAKGKKRLKILKILYKISHYIS